MYICNDTCCPIFVYKAVFMPEQSGMFRCGAHCDAYDTAVRCVSNV